MLDTIYAWQNKKIEKYHLITGNPPYISYNDASKVSSSLHNAIKAKNVRLNNVFGLNLHSIPGKRKKYSPKPNLYSFFLAQAFFLLHENGILSFLIPQNLLIAQDLDVLRYHLSKDFEILLIILVPEQMFKHETNRKSMIKNRETMASGLDVATSSLILLARKKSPNSKHKVKIYTNEYNKNHIDTKNTVSNINLNNFNCREIPQADLRNNLFNWNFIRLSPDLDKLRQIYSQNSQSLKIYFDHEISPKLFSSRFYFDKGFAIDQSSIEKVDSSKINSSKNEFYLIKRLKSKGKYIGPQNIKVSSSAIRFPQGSQGIQVLLPRYKIVWRYMNYNHFMISDLPLTAGVNYGIISSDNFQEMLYLWALLNSQLLSKIFTMYLQIDFEKDMLLGVSAMKNLFRIPLLQTIRQKKLKNRLISTAQQLFLLEKKGYKILNQDKLFSLQKQINKLSNEIYGL